MAESAASQPVDDLTEKEKEALRLLIAGHDAKSTALQLGLSVHTINDRLRSARRKLGTTTSREAARILHETEDALPHSSAHKPLGDEPVATLDHDDPTASKNGQEASRPRRLGKVAIIMSLTIAAGVLVFAFSGASEVSHPPRGAQAGQSQVHNVRSLGAAQDFLALLDRGDASGSYNAASPSMRQRHNVKMWELGVALRKNRGGVQNRELIESDLQTGQSGVDEGLVETLVFRTKLLDGSIYIERLAMVRSGGKWMAADYDMDAQDSRKN